MEYFGGVSVSLYPGELIAWIVLAPLRFIVWLFRLPAHVLAIVINGIVNWACTWANAGPRYRWWIVTIVSIIVTIITTQLFVTNWWISINYTITIIGHELFHFAVFRAYGVTVHIIAMLFIGAACVPDDKQYKAMNHQQKARMYMAGPIGSMVIGLFYILIGFFFLLSGNRDNLLFCLRFASFNLMLVLFNVMPVGMLDGGRVAFSILSSTNEIEDRHIEQLITVMTIIVFMGIFLLRGFNFELLLFVIVTIAGMHDTNHKDDPLEAYGKTKMNVAQIREKAIVMVALTLIAAIVYPILPNFSALLIK